MTVPEPLHDRGVWTLPNLISVGRLALVPVFLWLLLGADRPVAAGILLAALGATDWIDGWIARRYDQGSDVGKVLDPTADRVLLFAAVIALMVEGSVPIWLGLMVFVRELVIMGAVLALAAAHAARIDVQWSGKAGTLALMFGLPAFLLAETWGGLLLWAAAWGFSLSGLVLTYYATLQYVPLARRALEQGRAGR